MTLHVVEYLATGNGATVTLQSDIERHPDAISELQSMAARSRAIAEAAARGVTRPAVSGLNQAPYPITPEGRAMQNPLTEQVAAYRVDVQVTGSPI
jgi:hypothetical protein